MSRTAQLSASSSDEALLVAFLNGNKRARELFVQRFHEPLVKLVRYRLASDLGKRELAEDVVQRFWILLLSKSPSYYVSGQVEVLTHLRRLLLTAARDVRAEYKGTFMPRKRKAITQASHDAILPTESIDISAPKKSWECDVSLKDAAVEFIQASDNNIEQFLSEEEARWYLQRAHETAAAPIPQVLSLIYTDGLQVMEATRVCHVHHSTFRRRMQSYLRQGFLAA